MTSTLEAVSDALAATRVFALDPARRLNIAQQLTAYGVSAAMVKLVFAEALSSSAGPDQARALFANLLREPARLVEVHDDACTLQHRQRAARSADTSGMQFVSADNPYGWAQAEHHRHNDHEEPGAWNAFRQGYNMTTSEMLEVPTRDPRRHGCSRVEVLGEFDKARVKKDGGLAPDPVWDAGVVGVVREAEAVADRDIYGV